MELQIRDLAGELARAGHEVHVVTTTPADPRAQGGLQTGEVGVPVGVSVHRVRVPILPRVGFTLSPGAGPAMRRALDSIRPDVVHVHASIVSTGALAGAWAADRLGLPIVVTFHSVLGGWRHLLRAVDLGFGWTRWPSVFSAVSAAQAREVRWLARGRPVEVLPNGIDLGEWAPPAAPAIPTSDVSGDPLRLVTVQRLQARKRGVPLIRVVAEAAKRVPLHLTVIGDGPERPTMEAEARRLGIGAHVEFAGYLPRAAIRERFGRADAFVLLSVLESFGIAALEARAAGLPVVARRESGIAELLEDGREALLAASDQGVAEALVRLAEDPELRARLARHNRETPPRISWASTLARHLELYERAIRGG